ncbi:hypothetical protein SAMN05443549_109108 [Flavobacterium fluvii]|uniref:LysM domain-containing protein n=1 Tax=Flavobacterium fluvii TaxID=468056 RepID=A0A1M5P919_9FLAO|nr:LysM peptidoglycan-binding domain-containing protein [Flavobacterium fluvii]SHG98205.1 hypothetical protein SAMN05443549_109108 [Flavobacterium fluvii]
MKIIALHNQTLSDIAIRHCGTMEAVAEIAILNNMSITDDPIPGQLIAIPAKDYGNQEVINYFSANKVDPATAMKIPPIPPGLGIGFMRLGINFKIG